MKSTAIYDIQGAGLRSPLADRSVKTRGIVTAVSKDGFYLQDPHGDGDRRTSDAVFVFTGKRCAVVPGDDIRVSGYVREHTHAKGRELSTTQIADVSGFDVLSRGNALPAAVKIGTGGLTPPDGRAAATAFYESLEGMRVAIKRARVVGPSNRFGEIWVDGGATAESVTPRGGVLRDPRLFNGQRVQLQFRADISEQKMPSADVGDTVTNVVGVMGYGFGNYEVHPTESVAVISGGLKPTVTRLRGTATTLTVATANVFNTDPKVERRDYVGGKRDIDDDIGNGQVAGIAAQFVNNLCNPDIIALQEMQDSDGAEKTSTVSATQTAKALIDAIVAAGGPRYVYFDIPPADDEDGGQPGGNIRVGYLYNPARVNVVKNSAERVGTKDPAFQKTRKSLLTTFEFNGKEINLINNHLSSKRGSTMEYAEGKQVNGGEDHRCGQVRVLRKRITEIMKRADARVLLLGDFNENEYNRAIQDLVADTVFLLSDLLDEGETYSYVHHGLSQALDHMMASLNLRGKIDFEYVHVNAEFAHDKQKSDHDYAVCAVDMS